MKKTRGVILLAVLLAALVVSGVVWAHANSGVFDLNWNVVAGGGTTNATGSGGYTLGGTIGQADAGARSGGSYTLNDGFWHMARFYTVYLPAAVSNTP